MKNILFMIVTTIILVATCVVSDAHIDRSIQRLNTELAKIDTAENPYEAAEEFYVFWEQESLTWLIVLSHAEVDNITQHIYMMVGYAQSDSEKDFYAELSVTREMIQSMHDKTHLNLANLF